MEKLMVIAAGDPGQCVFFSVLTADLVRATFPSRVHRGEQDEKNNSSRRYFQIRETGSSPYIVEKPCYSFILRE